jgi:hypothetical protein
MTKRKNAKCDVSPRNQLRQMSKASALARLAIRKMTFCDASHRNGFRNMSKAPAHARMAICKNHSCEKFRIRVPPPNLQRPELSPQPNAARVSPARSAGSTPGPEAPGTQKVTELLTPG